MLSRTLRTLRQPRYASLSALMVVVALACIGAGTWQIVRFENKVTANDHLTANAKAAAVPVGRLVPLAGAEASSTDALRYRTVTATGRYDRAHQSLVRLRSVADKLGYYVLTPLTTSGGTLLVVRGFVAQRDDGTPPATVQPAPSGAVTVRARLQSGETRPDSPHGLPAGQLESINPTDQAARLGTHVYNGYAELLDGQPGQPGLTAIPEPDLSNPAGGAVEPQHFAYIIQWYLFAVLALGAPLAMARAEQREQAPYDVDATAVSAPDRAPSEDDVRAAKLADRYGRPVH